nr:hypothetical protein [uncultured Mediterraneibacter sp.]
MKKFILAGLICLTLLAALPDQMHVQAASGEVSTTTEFVYRTSKKTEINRGPGTGSGGNTAAKTGDTTEAGNWLMMLSGSALILFLLLWLRQREERTEDSIV